MSAGFRYCRGALELSKAGAIDESRHGRWSVATRCSKFLVVSTYTTDKNAGVLKAVSLPIAPLDYAKLSPLRYQLLPLRLALGPRREFLPRDELERTHDRPMFHS